MDAGTAAVLGALVGSVATIGAALATGWAQREGVRITARSEHRRERREPRQGAYQEFISSALSLHSQIHVFAGEAELVPEAISSDEYSQFHALASAVEQKSITVALAGPREVTEAALKIGRLSIDIASNIGAVGLIHANDEGSDERFRWKMRKVIADHAVLFESAVDNFVLLAQAALDDDGSRK
ncbi:hypothetical protein ACFZAG_02850 [Streptomyces sp. NPDC012403]|uniref:hypothetical protein n=1 Tax=Streptomyces sp. NPDC012403 TaxID=3364831 RepID=UPI0036ED0034